MSGETKRILFVDDEPNVLQGLQRMLREYRKDWSMSFALSGAAALELLGKEPFDVIVTDMRMPGMDGAELLTRVSKLHPRVVRLILSGQTDAAMTLRSIVTAHQYLSKPCDAKLLRATVLRACALRELMANQPLLALVSQVKSLPSLPSLYAEVVEKLRSPQASLNDVAQVIAKDPGMTAKVLQLVNSAFFGLKRRVASPVQAATLLGSETLKALVLSVEVFSSFDAATIQGLSLDAVWGHSMAVGSLARKIAISQDAGRNVGEDAFMAGLLHEVGTLVLAASLPRDYGRALALAAAEAVDIHEAERRVFGATHSQVGAYLIGIWGLPDQIVEAVAWHHDPARCPERTFTPLTAVHVANALEEPAAAPDLAYLEALGLTGRLETWRQLAAGVSAEAPA
jgi:HD-like signal output (HDOD) protein